MAGSCCAETEKHVLFIMERISFGGHGAVDGEDGGIELWSGMAWAELKRWKWRRSGYPSSSTLSISNRSSAGRNSELDFGGVEGQEDPVLDLVRRMGLLIGCDTSILSSSDAFSLGALFSDIIRAAG